MAAERVQVAVRERGEPCGILVPDLVALGAEPGDDGVDVLRRPQHDGVEDQAECAELVLRSSATVLASATCRAGTDTPGSRAR